MHAVAGPGARKRKSSADGRKGKRFRKAGVPAVVGVRSAGPEIKSLDVAQGATSITFPVNSAIAGTVLNDMATGDDIFTRTARTVNGKSIRIRGFFVPPAVVAGSVGDDYLRLVLVYDRQPNGAAATWATIFVDQSAAATASLVTAGVNMNFKDRFKILRDYTLRVPSIVATDTGRNNPGTPISSELCIDWYVPLKDLLTQYGTAAAGTINTGTILLIGQSAAGNGWEFDFSSRYRFADK